MCPVTEFQMLSPSIDRIRILGRSPMPIFNCECYFRMSTMGAYERRILFFPG